MGPESSRTVNAVWRRIDPVFVLIFFAALVFRIHLASTVPYIHDEENNAIPLSKTISFTPGHLNLPLRGENHPALPAYVVKASGVIFGTTPLGYRALHVLLGMCTIVLVFLLAGEWYGPVGARWAAALFAFNEYYLPVSARVTAHAPYLFIVAAAVYAFARFLHTQRVGFLYAAGLFVGLAFYCKELAVLLLPVFFATLLLPRYRHWLRRPHAYLACAVFVVVISPDFVWNLTTNRQAAQVNYTGELHLQATYSSHLDRIGGLGFSLYPAMFYGRDVVRSAYLRATGESLYDETPEYRSVNTALGAMFLAAVLLTTFRPPENDQVRGFLLLMFWGVFLFFTFIAKGNPPGRLSPVSWMWVDITLIPAVVLTGGRLADRGGSWRLPTWGFSTLALLYAAWAVY